MGCDGVLRFELKIRCKISLRILGFLLLFYHVFFNGGKVIIMSSFLCFEFEFCI